MQYTENEIVQSYLRSGKKARQITILAELNACGVENIRANLIKHGVLKETESDRRYAEELAKKAAGENAEVYCYTPQDFKAGFVRMANYIADCITAMEAIDPDSPNADKERRAYLDEIEYVRDFLSRSRIKTDDSTSD